MSPVRLGSVAFVALSALVACAELKQAEPGGETSAGDRTGAEDPAPGPAASSPPPDQTPTQLGPATTPTVSVTKIVEGRSRIGARSEAGFKAWRSGLVATADKVLWVESGATPGLYAAPFTGCAGAACQKVTAITRPAVVAASDTELYFADVKVLKRLVLADLGAAPATVVSSADEILGLGLVAGAVFWTTERGAIQRTVLGGTTSTPINSNGTPVSMGSNGSFVYWLGTDISGQQGLLQRIAADGTKPRAIADEAGPLFALAGSPTGHVYFSRGNPAEVRRINLAGQEEVVASNLARVSDFAFDAEYAYWTEQGAVPDYLAGRVQRVRHDATNVEQIATNIPRPVAIAVRGKDVFVASGGTQAADYADGAILRMTVSP